MEEKFERTQKQVEELQGDLEDHQEFEEDLKQKVTPFPFLLTDSHF